MSDNNNERRELTAAELDLVAGGVAPLQNTLITSYFMAPRNGETGLKFLDQPQPTSINI